jgi:hypothetical protein
MTLRRYTGKLYYDYEGNDHLDVSAFIVRDKEIAFSLASVTQEHGRWDAESGRPAILQPDGSYLAQQVQAHKSGVTAEFPWDITFHIAYEDLGNNIEVSGTLVEGGEPYEFGGYLDAIPN